MKVPYGEGVASHTDPESCVGDPQGRRRSVDRGTCGPGIEPRKEKQLRGANGVVGPEGNMESFVTCENVSAPAWS